MRIAIVNDLSLAREVLRRLVLSQPGHSVAWFAADGEEAVRKALTDRPDAILMDLVMPVMNGVEATRRIMKQAPCPILVVTATISGHYELVIQAMGAGALDAVETPVLGLDGEVRNGEPLIARLTKLVAVSGNASCPVLHITRATGTGPRIDRPPLVLIGSSTGGPDALAVVLRALPASFPAAVLVAQHIAAEFAPSLAKMLGDHCALPVRLACAGDAPTAGVVAIAATDDHLEVTPDLKLAYTASPRDNPFRPSADVLFASAGAVWPRLGVAVLLTGMGCDGAEGLLRLRELGWHTIAQDEATCVVYGMPRVAAERGAAAEILPIARIGPAISTKILGPKR